MARPSSTVQGNYSSPIEALKAAGQWNLTDPNSDAWKYIQANFPRGGASSKDQRGSMIHSVARTLIAGGVPEEQARALATKGYDDAKHMQYLKKRRAGPAQARPDAS